MNMQSENRWKSLPVQIKKYYQTNPLIHYYVDAYCCGVVSRDKMYIDLVSKLADNNEYLMKDSIKLRTITALV